jgi:hypothetical protein
MQVLTEQTNELFEGTAGQIVRAMAASSWFHENKLEYMHGVADRLELWNGQVIRYDSPLSFLLGLEHAGLILIEQN